MWGNGGRGRAPEFLRDGGEMGALMRAHDWSSTPLGPPESWPQSLRTVVRILLTSRYQMWMAWGEELSFFYNDAYRPTLGVKHGRALGASAREVWKEIWPDIGPRIEHVLNTGEATWDEGLLLFLERSGYTEETYHTFSYSPLSDDRGVIVGMLCVVTEETERIIGERRLFSLRELASEIAGKSTSAEVLAATDCSLSANLKDLPFTLIYQFDPDGVARLTSAIGVAPGHAVAPTAIAPHDNNAPWPAGELLQRASLSTVGDLALRFDKIPKGAWPKPPHEAVIAPMAQQGQHRPAGFLVAGINPFRRLDDPYCGFISLVAGQIAAALANAQAYEEERRRAQALAEIDQAKTTFFSNVSHEFRTPLTLMLSPLEEALTLSDVQIGPDTRSLVTVAHRNGMRLLKLVNTLLDFSRIEAGRVTASYEATNLAQYTAELASNFRSALDKAGLRLVIEADPLPQPVYVDRDMWEKIVLNLLSNAFKFTFEGQIAVTVRAASDASHAEVSVRDTGTGIPAHELPHLFERFRRVDGARGRSFEGSGIGLALVQELVKQHGGEIGVRSEVGRGSTFTISIPFGTAHLPGDRLGAPRPSVSTYTRAQTYVDEAMGWLEGASATDLPQASTAEDLGREATDAVASRELILLADDNTDMRDYVRRLLSEHYQVEVVKDGQAALEAAWRRRPDLILSDVMMPALDGFGLLQALRNDGKLRDVPVILLSARAGEEAKLEGLEAGANDYLSKPFSARELLARVRANIDMANLRREALRTENELRLQAETAQERAETILASINDGLIVLDSDWRFTYANAAAERMLSSAAADLIGKNHWDVYPATIGTIVETNYRRAMSERAGLAFENFYEPWQRWFDLRVYPSRDGGLSIYFQDATDRKKAEEVLRRLNETLERQVVERTAELQEKQARLRTIFETSYAYQGLISLDGTLLDANSTSLSGIGATLGDVVGLPFWETPWFTGTPDMAEMVRTAISAVAGGETVRQEIHVNLPIGGWRWFDFQMRPVRDDKGAVVAIVPEAVEVTERRAAEEAVRHSQKMDAIGQLTGGVAHDFNNLLTIIRSSADLLRRRDLPAERFRRYVDAISDTADRAAKLTKQLLIFSRRHPVTRDVFDIADQLRRIREMLQTVLGSHISLQLDIAEQPLAVETDANQFENVMVNLVANARDAMEGRGALSIRLARAPSSDATGEFVTVAVRDTGCGIPASQIEKIFEPFFTTKPVGRGTGLGLSQVYGFVQQSGGKVTIDSTVGVGTTITLYLPLSSKPIQPKRDGRAASTDSGIRARVLVVEDNAQVGEFSSQLLLDLGYETVLAPNAEEALQLIEKEPHRFDIVFSDVVMPGIDGVALGHQIRQRFPHMPFVLTSGYSHVLTGESQHGFELLQKPFSVEDLSRVLRRALMDRVSRSGQ
jgi:PAS domain S-box-containing protein